MSTVKVNVKWGKKKYEKVEVDLAEPPAVFKSQLFSLTGVPLERQKLMIGGLILGDEDWSNTKSKVKNNATFMMMGSADSLPEAPKLETKFLEDMTDTEAAAALSLPTGIENFGNTCYMNATLQCLKVVPELRTALGSYHVPATRAELMDADTASPQSLTRDLKMLYLMMESGQDIRIPSMLFLHTLHVVKPEFAHKDEKTGAYKQQDAHECWSAMVNNLSETLRVPGIPPSANQEATGGRSVFIKQYFGVETKSTYKCEECPDEPVTTETETSYQVSCFIAQDVKYMHTAIRKGMEGTVEKKSAVLGRDAVFKKTSLLSRLPGYLTVQFVRFSVGVVHDSVEVVARKILKDVKYTMKLDMYEFCTTELQKKLNPMRTKFKEQEERKLAQKAKLIAEGELLGPKLAGTAAKAKKEENVEYEPFQFEDDVGSNNSGFYELAAVLTHKGRSSSSGHYVGWVALKNGEWAKLDDDNVSLVTEEQILKLSGGGDWHVAYILLYAPRRLEKMREEEEEEETTPTAEETSAETDVQMETADSADRPPPPPTN